MARALWPQQDAIGKCFRRRSDTVPCTTVVGVAEDLAAVLERDQHLILRDAERDGLADADEPVGALEAQEQQRHRVDGALG